MTFDLALPWRAASPALLAIVAALLASVWLIRRQAIRQVGPLLIAAALFWFAYASPIGPLADGYLFSAHMVQHLLLLLVIPLLLWLAVPPRESSAQESAKPAAAWIPAICWLCGVGAMWFWHVPTFCSASSQSAALGVVRDVTFVLAGLAFWLPIFGTSQRFRLPPPTGIAYLFSACLGCTLLGIYVTFTTISVCPAFADPVGRVEMMQRLHEMGLSRAADQQLGGLLMWVPPCTLYIVAILALLGRWYHATEEHVAAPLSGRAPEVPA